MGLLLYAKHQLLYREEESQISIQDDFILSLFFHIHIAMIFLLTIRVEVLSIFMLLMLLQFLERHILESKGLQNVFNFDFIQLLCLQIPARTFHKNEDAHFELYQLYSNLLTTQDLLLKELQEHTKQHQKHKKPDELPQLSIVYEDYFLSFLSHSLKMYIEGFPLNEDVRMKSGQYVIVHNQKKTINYFDFTLILEVYIDQNKKYNYEIFHFSDYQLLAQMVCKLRFSKSFSQINPKWPKMIQFSLILLRHKRYLLLKTPNQKVEQNYPSTFVLQLSVRKAQKFLHLQTQPIEYYLNANFSSEELQNILYRKKFEFISRQLDSSIF